MGRLNVNMPVSLGSAISHAATGIRPRQRSADARYHLITDIVRKNTKGETLPDADALIALAIRN